MKTNPIYFKYSVILVVAVLLFLLFKGCWSKPEVIHTRPTIVTKIDTFYTETKIDTHYVPKPYKVTAYKSIYIHDTLIENTSHPPDVYQLQEALYSKHFYKDTVVRGDNGIVVVTDTVSMNHIMGRGVHAELKQREITKTVTITGTMPEKTILFVGFGFAANKNSWLGTMADLSLQTKNRKIYSIGAVLDNNGKIYYNAGLKLPIRFNNTK